MQMSESTACTLTVVDDLTGKPVPDARVRVWQELQSQPLRVTQALGETNELGRVALTLPTGDNTVQLDPSGENGLFSYPTTRPIAVSRSARDLQVRMNTGAWLDFNVIDAATGKGIPYRPVAPSPLDSLTFRQRTHGRGQGSEVNSAQQGITQLECLPGKAKFTVLGAAHAGYEVVQSNR